ncbi:MAG: putative capsid protein [Arizlama virus AZLM_757]|nr:MAG: putative capsid protein [Arizlama virus]
MSFSFHVPQILDFSKTLLSSTFPSTSYTTQEKTLLAIGSALFGGAVNSKKRKFGRIDSQETLVGSSDSVDQMLSFRDPGLPTLTETEEENSFPEMSAASAPLRAKAHYSFGKPLNNVYPATLRSMSSWGSLYGVVTGQQNFATIASIGSVSQVGVNSPTATDFRFGWPKAYLNLQPDTTTSVSDISTANIPKTTSIGLSRVYNEFQFKNLQNIGVSMELMLVCATDNCSQEPVLDLIDASTVYGQTQSTWAGPNPGETVTGAVNGRPTINHLGFRMSDAEDFFRKYKVLRKHPISLGHGQTVIVDYTVDFNRVFTQAEWDEANAQGDFTIGNKTLFFVIRYSGEPVVDITPTTGGNNLTTSDVSLAVITTQKKIFKVPKGYGKLRINQGSSRLSVNVSDSNQQTMDVEDNKGPIEDAFI